MPSKISADKCRTTERGEGTVPLKSLVHPIRLANQEAHGNKHSFRGDSMMGSGPDELLEQDRVGVCLKFPTY